MKKYNDETYTGMKVGGSHFWKYPDGKWIEKKVAPDRWKFSFNSTKVRYREAPVNSGAKIDTKYHWYVIADQIATKLDANSYMTQMKGVKFKIGHKRPYWKTFSYNYPEQQSYKEHVIEILEHALRKLKEQ